MCTYMHAKPLFILTQGDRSKLFYPSPFFIFGITILPPNLFVRSSLLSPIMFGTVEDPSLRYFCVTFWRVRSLTLGREPKREWDTIFLAQSREKKGIFISFFFRTARQNGTAAKLIR